MRGVCFVLACVVATAGLDLQAQRRGAGRATGSATLVIVVTDPSGAPVPDVVVTVEGPANRSARTEGGRIAFESLPPGNYLLRFEREGFVPLERELTARGGPATDVKVTLKPAPPPPKPAEQPPKQVEPLRPAVNAEAAVFDVPAVFEKEFIGRAAGRTTPLACGANGSATLIQIKEPIAQHAHPDSDEFLYVIGGEGRAQVAGREERLKAGLLLFVPRGVAHALSAAGRNPLVVVSTRAGEGCRAGG